MSRVEQPSYAVTAADGAFEIRAYGPMIAAETEVHGERKAAIRQGFSLIAAYIFGANETRTALAMTANVQSEVRAARSSQTIAMTAPVIQQRTASSGSSWSVRFIMPHRWTMETLPQPKDASVKIVPIQAKRVAVVRFSGSADDMMIAQKTNALKQYAAANNLRIVGAPVLAFYNPPWTLPIFRRNEVMFEVAPPVLGH